MLTGCMIRALALGAVAVAAVPQGASAADPEVTLTIHHSLGPRSTTQVKMIEPWAERIEEASNGRIAFEIFPSMSMGGKPSDLYRQVQEGTADIVWTAIGHTPEVFARTEVFELPTVHLGSALATNLAIHDSYDLIAGDYEGLEPLLIHTHDGNALHVRRSMNDVISLEVFKGMKLRTPSRTGAWIIEALGAESIEMAGIALPRALFGEEVDGALGPFELFPSLRLAELTRTSVEGRGKQRFGTSVFLFAMNKQRFEGMPDDLRGIIEDHSDRDFAEEIGRVWEEAENEGKRRQFESGSTILRLNDEVTTDLATHGQAVVDRWIEEVSSEEMNGRALVEAARKAVEKNTN